MRVLFIEQSLRCRSALLDPPRGWLMAALRAYFDDSGKADDPQHELITVAGYVGQVEAWAAAEAAWNSVLAHFGMPYLHMKNFAHLGPPFDVLRSDRERGVKFLNALIDVIGASGLTGVGSVTRLAHLKRFNREMRLELDALAVATYGSVIELHDRFPGQSVEVIFDRIEKPYLMFNRVEGYGKTDQFYKGYTDNVTFSVIPKSSSFRNMAAIQMADLAAWEARRAHSMQTEWFDSLRPSNLPNEWVPSLTHWQLEKFGQAPAERSSFSRVVRAAGLHGIVWDYDCLMTAHKVRGGSWKP